MLSNEIIKKCEDYLYNLSGEDFEKLLNETYDSFWHPMEKFNEIFRKLSNIAEAIQNMSPNFDFSHKFFHLGTPSKKEIVSANKISFTKEERKNFFGVLLYNYKNSYWHFLPEYIKSLSKEERDIDLSIFLPHNASLVKIVKEIHNDEVVYVSSKVAIVTRINSSLDKEVQDYCSFIENYDNSKDSFWTAYWLTDSLYYLNDFESKYSLFINKLRKYKEWEGYYMNGYGLEERCNIQKYMRKNSDGSIDKIIYHQDIVY